MGNSVGCVQLNGFTQENMTKPFIPKSNDVATNCRLLRTPFNANTDFNQSNRSAPQLWRSCRQIEGLSARQLQT
jgi:hypothetical protein